MIPCKFFMKGTCRYGEQCRFSHQSTNQYNQNPFGGGRQMNPVGMSSFGNYSHQNNYAQQAQQSRNKIDESLKVIEEAVRKDMIEWERGKIWPFSSYGPLGGKPNLPGFEDLSAEELRYATMQNNGQPPSEIAIRFSQWNGYRSNYQMINPSNRQLLQQISLAQSGQQISLAQPGQQQQPTGLPFQSPQQTAPSIFGGSPSFGGAGTSSTFGLNNQSTSQFMGGMNPNPNPAFPSMSSNFFGLNKGPGSQTEQMEDTGPAGSSLPQFSFNQVLSQTQQQQQPSMFGNPSPFGAPSLVQSQNPPAFGVSQSSLFGNQPSQMMNPNPNMSTGFIPGASSFPTANNSIFGMPPTLPINNNNPGMMSSNMFGGGASGGGGDAIDEDFSIYSKDTDLTDVELRAYENNSFEIDTLPLHAPSKRFCC